MPKAIIYLGSFAYDLGNVFARAVGEGLKSAGYEIITLDLLDQTQCQLAQDRRIYHDCELVFAVNAIRPKADEGSFRYYRDTGCVFVGMMIDPPILQYARLFYNNDLITFIDRSHVTLVQRYFQMPSQSRFLPHGGSQVKKTITTERRRFPLIFAGTWSDPETHWAKIADYPDSIRKIFSETIDLLLSRDDLDPFLALEQIMLSYDLNPAESDVLNAMIVYYAPLDAYIRARKRLDMLRAFDEAGIKVDIWGNHWPTDRFKVHEIHPPRPLEEINQLMSRSQIVLDLGMYPDGSHERVFNAMLNGAVAITVDNPWHRENFRDGDDIILYRTQNPEQLLETVTKLQQAPEQREAIAASGQAKAEKEHTWTTRASQIITMVKEYRERSEVN